jgi:general secretion pathway protein N
MKFIRNLILLVLLLALLAALALAFLPARIALDFVGGRLGPVELGEVSGSLWKGQASPASINGEPIGTLGWKLHPLSLLGARVDADLRLQGDVYNGAGAVSVHRDRSVRVRDLMLTMPAQRLQPALDIPALVLRGEVQVEIDTAEVRGGFPSAVQGRAIWKNAAVAGSAEAQFGELTTEFATTPAGGIAGTVKDNGGPLQAEGSYEASLLGYSADVVLRARDGNPQVTEALQYIGAPQSDGSARLEVRGKLLGDF